MQSRGFPLVRQYKNNHTTTTSRWQTTSIIRRRPRPQQQQPQRRQSSNSTSSSSSSNTSTGGGIGSAEPPQSHYEALIVYANLLGRFGLALGLAHCVSEYVAEITLCEGPSMLPTLRPSGEIVLIDKWTLPRIHAAAQQRQRRRQAQYNQGVAVDRTVLQQAIEDDALIDQGELRVQRARQRQRAFEEEQLQKWKEQQQQQQQQQQRQSKMEKSNSNNHNPPTHAFTEEWYEPRISVSDQTATWTSLWQLLTTPLSMGDVVVLEHPHRNGTVCKRVVGLPGDTVLRPQGLLVIPDGHVWVEGDNPANSSDSRSYGAVPLTLIQGRVLCRVWPLRGHALLQRGTPPTTRTAGAVGSTVLPAGYEGQHIVKSSRVRMQQ